MQFILGLLTIVLNRSQRDEEDVSLLKRIAQGEESALSDLYTRYAQLLYSFGMRVLRSSEETEDLMQDVFLQTWNKAHTYENVKGSVYTWLVTMTRNRAIDRVRSKGFKQQSRNIDMENITLIADTQSSNPLSRTVLNEDQKIVTGALKQLSVDQQAVIALAYYDGHSQSEIASVLKIPLGTVKSRMRKGLSEMRSMLKENM